MRSSASLDRRVRREAKALIKLAGERGKPTAAAELSRPLADGDLAQVRRRLAAVDGLVGDPPARGMVRDQLQSIGSAVLIALALRAFVVEAFKIPSASMYPTLEINDHIFVNKIGYGVRIPWTDTKLIARSPARGDVIVFVYPCDPDKDYIKRVIALAGQTVEVRCNIVYVDGVAVPSVRVPGECRYFDRDENGGPWFDRRCSRYRETGYDTFHDPGRPNQTGADSHDFPSLANPEPPACAGAAPTGTVSWTQHGAPTCSPQLHYTVPDGHIFVMGDNRNNSNDSRAWGSVPLDAIKGKAMFMWLSYKDLPMGIRWDRIGAFVH